MPPWRQDALNKTVMERDDQTLASEQENKKPGCPKSRPVVQTCHVQRSCPTEAVLSPTSILKGTAYLVGGDFVPHRFQHWVALPFHGDRQHMFGR